MPTEQIFTQLITTLYRQMPPNIQLSWIKNAIEQSKNSSFEIKGRVARIEIGDSSRNLSLVQCQEIKFTILVTV